MELTLNQALKGKATQIKGKEYFTRTAKETSSFFRLMCK